MGLVRASGAGVGWRSPQRAAGPSARFRWIEGRSGVVPDSPVRRHGPRDTTGGWTPPSKARFVFHRWKRSEHRAKSAALALRDVRVGRRSWLPCGARWARGLRGSPTADRGDGSGRRFHEGAHADRPVRPRRLSRCSRPAAHSRAALLVHPSLGPSQSSRFAREVLVSSSPHRTGAQIRREFLDFFGARAHSVQPSSSLVPNDPTLMFVNAGMVQFKDVFTGKEQRDYKRATTSQKCLRVSGKHNDLEEVGRTPRHHTLFEMLGNFSFGDYFKEEAIGYAWTLVKDVWKLDLDKVWVTVHHSDDEAWDLWTRKFGVPEARMQRLGDKDNFWSMGDTGPCGPCTEIHYDLGPSMGDCLKGPAGESDRYMEFWNLVFMQYEQFADGSRQPLANPSVDTGMGLERITGILQGVTTNYETDLIEGLMAVGAEQAKIDMKTADEERMTALRVLADHSRATAFMIADGIIPSNEGRGYVLRRIARRAIRWGVKLGLGANPFFHHVTSAVVDQMGEAFPELREREAFIREVVKGEEVRFGETRDKGLALLDEALAKVSDGTLDGTTVFKLHDTFGFPSDLTALIANEKGIKVDMAGFSEEMEAQRERGRAAWKGSGSAGVDRLWHSLLAEHPTAFTGYTDLDDAARVVALVHDGAKVDTLPDGAEGVVILDRTPFYGESGGQVGDTGTLTAGGVSFAVSDTRKPVPGLHAHHGSARGGALRVGDKVQASVHAVRRNDIR
ncbi:MAG TPA: alanine--tRNA ligase, partial [Deltaproteobacteria bacterium]|nr:alanine--tRNA ligase [Deltaproteobacteria bacterium]